MKYDANMVLFGRQRFLCLFVVTLFNLVEVTPEQWQRNGYPRLKLVQIVSAF